MTDRSLPCALCPVCQTYRYDSAVIGIDCGNPGAGGIPCTGRWQNRLRLTDWVNCPSCNGTGYINKKRCLPCKNSGWLPAR